MSKITCWTEEEDMALQGLPLIAQLVYLRGLRRVMDYSAGTVGERRRISWQALREVVFVEPHQGVSDGGTPTLGKVRRAVDRLIKAGLVEDIGTKQRGEAIVFFLPLAQTDESVRKKPGMKSARAEQEKVGKAEATEFTSETTAYPDTEEKPGMKSARAETQKVGTPPVSGIGREEKSTTYSCSSAHEKRRNGDDAAEVLTHLNAVTGSTFKATGPGGKPTRSIQLINARLAEHGKEILLRIIDRKAAEWLRDDKMRQYLRPATLFGREKCEQYAGQLSIPVPPTKEDREWADLEAWFSEGDETANVIEGVFTHEK